MDQEYETVRCSSGIIEKRQQSLLDSPRDKQSRLGGKEDNGAKLVRLARLEKPVESQETYNPLRKVTTKIDPISAKSFVNKAKADYHDHLEAQEIKYPKLSTLETIEMRIYNHNAKKFLSQYNQPKTKKG